MTNTITSHLIFAASVLLMVYFIKKMLKSIYDEVFEYTLDLAKKEGVIIVQNPEFTVWELKKWGLKIRITDRK